MFARELAMARPQGTLGDSLTFNSWEPARVALLFLRGDDA